jgi:arylsulfatase A-like enzyme
MPALSKHSTIFRARRLAALAAAAALLAGTLALAGAARDAEGAPGDNVVFILTDDQSATELAAMPNTQALIGGQGMTFTRAYIPYPLCCPSRASMLTGEYMHNHGVRGNAGPFGGWERLRPHESDTVATHLQDDGYYNVHVGKYVNGYAVGPPTPLPVPEGWDEWYGKVSEGPLYFNYSLIEKEGPADTPELAFYGDQTDEYQTDVLGDKAVDFIDTATAVETPFMMNVWFNAPHGPFDPAPRHLFTLSGAALPRLQAFDEKDLSDKPKWLRKQARKRLGKALKQTIASERRRRLEQLLSVDEAVGDIVAELSQEDLIDETYIIFASDNGFFRGEHRIAGGKYLAYEPSSRVPLMIRGPGITAGVQSDELVSAIDIPQTIEEIATGATDPDADGRSFLPYALNPTLRSTRPLLLEADTGPGQGNAGFDPQTASVSAAQIAKVKVAGRKGVKNLDQEKMATKTVANGNFAPAYRAVRTSRYLYVLYANGQSELYDLLLDPAQLRSKHADPRYRFVRKFLFGQLVALSTCRSAGCRTEAGPDPAPLPKKKAKPKRKRKPKPKGKT